MCLYKRNSKNQAYHSPLAKPEKRSIQSNEKNGPRRRGDEHGEGTQEVQSEGKNTPVQDLSPAEQMLKNRDLETARGKV